MIFRSPLAIMFYGKVDVLTLLRPECAQISLLSLAHMETAVRTGNRYKSRLAKTVNMCLFNLMLSHLKRNCLCWPKEFPRPPRPFQMLTRWMRKRGWPCGYPIERVFFSADCLFYGFDPQMGSTRTQPRPSLMSLSRIYIKRR